MVPSSLKHRVLGAAGSQVLSSLTNLFAGVFVLRFGGGVGAFSEFALATAVYLVFLSIYRSLVAEPFLALRAGSDSELDAWRSTLAIAIAAAIVVLALAAPSSQMLGKDSTWLLLSLSLPGLIVHDHIRQASFRTGDAVAIAVDGTWLVLLIGSWTLLGLLGISTHEWLGLAVWGASGSVAAFLFWFRDQLHGGSLRLWITGAGKRGPSFALEFLIERGGFQISAVAFASIAGVLTFGEWRVAQLLIGPLTVTHATAFSVLVPVLARSAANDRNFRSALTIAFSTILSFDLAVVLCLAFAPTGWLALFLGAEAVPDRRLILLVGGYTALWGVSAVGRAAHRSNPKVTGSLGIRVLTGALAVAATLPTIRAPRAEVYAGALLAGALVTSVAWLGTSLVVSRGPVRDEMQQPDCDPSSA